MYNENIIKRFWAKVKIGTSNECWEWTANYIRNGYHYGLFMVSSGKFELAHRVSWKIKNNKEIPSGLCICHRCDNPSCVNPEHLFPGTHQDNMRDMTSKGRNVTRKGERNNRSKLTQSQVQEIRTKSAFTTQVQLAKDYRVSQAAIWYILRNRNWKDID